MGGSGRTALVTGASRGIGRAVALALAERGARVVVSARGAGGCEETAAAIRAAGGEAEALPLDVAEASAAAAAAAAGPFDWLVNNAGIAESAPIHRTSEELHRRHMEVNYHGARRLAEALLPAMRERGYGRIVNVASSAGLHGYPYVTAYCASKFALVGWTLAAAAELEGSGVGVNAVCPHYVDSPMLEAAVRGLVEKAGRSEAEARAFFARQNPGGRLVTPEEVAAATVALCTGEESGTLLELDGTRTIRRRPDESPAAGG